MGEATIEPGEDELNVLSRGPERSSGVPVRQSGLGKPHAARGRTHLHEQKRDTSMFTCQAKPGRADRHIHPEPFGTRFWDRLPGHYGLTVREVDVLRLVCRGFTDQSIAALLHIAHPTVRSHLRLSYRKLNCRDRVDAILTLAELARYNGHGISEDDAADPTAI